MGKCSALTLACLLFVATGCTAMVLPERIEGGGNATHVTSVFPLSADRAVDASLFASLPTGDDARIILCNPPLGHDVVVQHLCGNAPPVLTSLRDLQRLLGFEFADATATGSNGGADGNPVYALTAHSSSLVVKSVSALNPRSIVCKDFGAIQAGGQANPQNPNFFACLGFTRGENLVEVATTDAVTGALNFYIVKFETACSVRGSCTPGDLLMPADEASWVAYNAYQDDPFLKNTVMDCRQCHQPDASAPPILRMQETTAPYTHFVSASTVGGRALLADFQAAHGTQEDYGFIPAALIPKADGASLAHFLDQEGFLTRQPNAFDSATIESQVVASAAGQPGDNAVAGKSVAWDALFANFTSGLAIAPPYHDVKVTDPNKLAALSEAYARVKAGDSPASALPDLRDVFSDAPQVLAEMGLAAVPHQGAKALVANACKQCHNDKLDQKLSRARFSVDALLAGTMEAAEKQIAVDRLTRPSDDLQRMPPSRFRTLSSDDIDTLVHYLEQP